MIKGARVVLVIILSFFIANFISAAAIEDNLHLNIQTTNSSGGIISGTFNFIFSISTSSDCSNVVYTNSASLTSDSRGIISYYLTNTGLNYSDQYWLCYYRDGVLISSSKIARSPYSFSSRNITLSGTSIDTNLNTGGYNITTLGGWLNGGVSILGGDIFARTLFVYNISSLNINNLNMNGSFFPAFDSIFDLGNSSMRWRNLYVKTVNISNDLWVNGVNISTSNYINPIVASGNNSNGYYVEYIDGTMTQWGSFTRADTINIAYFGGFRGTGFNNNFPIPFVDSVYSVVGTPGGNTTSTAFGFNPYVFNNSAFGNVFTSVSSQGALNVNATWIAHGRWTNTPYNTSTLSIGGGIPAGAIVPFNSPSCPVGWSLADGTSGNPDLRGIFVRGSGTNGKLSMANGTAFNANYGNYSNDSLQGHTHTVGGSSGAAGTETLALAATSKLNDVNPAKYYDPGNDGINGNARYGAETTPAYYATIYCVKMTQDTATSNSLWQLSGNTIQLANSSQTVNIQTNLTLGGGQIAYNSTAGSYYYNNGTSWYPFGTGTSSSSSGNGTFISSTNLSASLTVAANVFTKINWSTPETDTLGEFNSSNDFVPKNSGIYLICASLVVSNNTAVSKAQELDTFYNGVRDKGFTYSNGPGVINSGCTVKKMNAGDFLSVYVYSSVSGTYTQDNNWNWLKITNLGAGSSGTSSSVTQNASFKGYNGFQTQHLGGFSLLNITSVNYDSSSGFNATNKSYTIPVSGYYIIQSKIRLPDTYPGNNNVGLSVINNSEYSISGDVFDGMQWFTSSNSVASANNRTLFSSTRINYYTAGDQIIGVVFLAVPTNISIGNEGLTVQLISPSSGGGTSYFASNGSNIYNLTAKVGIGTANPTQMLDVNGSVNISKDLFVNGVNISSGNYINPIVASGSNVNGSYIEYIDGTMVEWGNTSIFTATFGIDTPQNIIYPIAFVSPPIVTHDTVQSTVTGIFTESVNNNNNTGALIYVKANNVTGNTSMYWTATGKWTSTPYNTSTLSIGGGIPAGAISPFNLLACPIGWTQVGTQNGTGIVASGNNSNGNYIEFSDGSMTQWGIFPNGTSSSGGPWTTNFYYYLGVVTLPVTFVDTNYRAVVTPGNSGTFPLTGYQPPGAKLTTGFSNYIYSDTNEAISNGSWIATGKWTNTPQPSYVTCQKATQDSATSNSIWGQSGNNIFLQNLSLNVGIGTTSPLTTLHVQGNMTLTGSLNMTLTGNTTYFSNGCYQVVNSTGMGWIC